MSTTVITTAQTFASLIERIRGDETLRPADRKSMTSALRSLARVTGRPVETIPADLPFVRDLFENASPARGGLSKAYWTNVKCHVMRGLRYCGINILSGRCHTALPEEWAALVFQMEEPERRVMLSFFRYCIEQGLGPHDVTQEVFDNYAGCLEMHSSRTTRWVKFCATRRIWNKCSATVEEWPNFIVTVTDGRDRYGLPPERFPVSLREEIEALLFDIGNSDVLSFDKKTALRPTTIAHRRYTLYRLASAAAARGVAPESLVSLRHLVDEEVVRRGLRFLLERAGKNCTEDVFKVAEIIHAIAKHHVGLEGEKLARLRAMRDNIRKSLPSRGMTEKNRSVLRPFEDEELVASLLHLPQKLVHRLRQDKKKTRLSAARLANALALEILSVAPIRISNLAGIRLDQHLLRVGRGLHLVIPGQEVKNSEPLEFVLPSSTVALLELYLKQARPRLCEASSVHLFPGKVDGHQQPNHMSAQLAKLTATEIGVRITAHQFRHLAGFLFLRQNPGCYEVVRQLLGHRSITTTMKFYAGMERDAAMRLYDDFLQQRRKELSGKNAGRRS